MRRLARSEVLRTLVAVSVLSGAACAPSAPSVAIALPTRQFALDHFLLPSGVQILIEEDPTEKTVASVLVVAAGAADDPQSLGGLAHLVEHLSFRSHAEGQAPLSSRLAAFGVGAWNAETTHDATVYYEVGAAETLPKLVEVALDRIVDPLQGI